MHARVTTAQVAPDKLDEAVQLWRETVGVEAQEQPGFRSVRLLIDRQTGKVLALSIWDDVANVQSSNPWNQAQITRLQGLFNAPAHVEDGFEVAAEITAP